MNNKFSWKAFISFGLTYSFIIILVSGIILYIAPPGRYANWVTWKISGLTKESWQSLHIVFSFSFVFLSVFHLFTVNWKAFLSYLKSKSQSGLNKKREFITTTGLFILFVFGILFSVPPFKFVMDLSAYFTESWEKTENEPPVPHAELLTLAELDVQLTEMTLDDITVNLNKEQVKFDNTNQQTLGEIAELNQTTPLVIYQKIIQKYGNQLQGSGVGRKTLEEFAVEAGKNIEEVLIILEENNIKAEKGQTLKVIGDNNKVLPRDIHDLIIKK
jgi:hypothetical protein